MKPQLWEFGSKLKVEEEPFYKDAPITSDTGNKNCYRIYWGMSAGWSIGLYSKDVIKHIIKQNPLVFGPIDNISEHTS